MNKILIYSILFLLVLSGCNKSNDSIAPEEDSISTKDTTQRTVLMYMFQDTDLWMELTKNVNDIEQGWNDGIDGTMLVYLDPSPKITQFGGKPVLLKIQHDSTDLIVSKVVKVYQDRDAADADVFKQVQQDAIDMYPADSYGLIISGHGSGFFVDEATKGLGGSDRWGNNSLDIDVISKNMATYYDFIILDACTMGETTTLYQLRNATDFVVASVEESPGDGFAYRSALAALFTQPQADLFTFSSYTSRYYRDDPDGQASVPSEGYVTIGVYRMSEIEKVASVTKQAIDTLNSQYNQLHDAITELIADPERETPSSLYYPCDMDYKAPWYYDMGLLVELLKNEDHDDLAEELNNALDKFVIQSNFVFSDNFTSENPNYQTYTKNVSFYLPHSEGSTNHIDNAFYNRFDWAAAAGFSTKWETIN